MRSIFFILCLLALAPLSFGQCQSGWFNGIGAPPNGASAQSFLSMGYANGKIFCSNQMSLADSLVSGNVSIDTDPSMIFPKVQYLVAMDTSGITDWIVSIGCELFLTNETCMANDELGNSYLCMNFPGDLYLPDTSLSVANGNCMISKFDQNGSRVWTNQYQGSGIPRAVWCNGKLVFALGYQGQIEVEGTNYTSDGEFDFLIIWMNSDGEVEQLKEVKGVGEATVYDMSCLEQNLFLQGRFNRTFSYDGNFLGTASETQYRSYQVFTDTQGNQLWNTQSTFHVGGGWHQDASVRLGNQIISVGRNGAEGIMFDNLSIPHFGGGDGYICGQNLSNGSFNWLKGFGADGGEYLVDVEVYEENLIITGHTASEEVPFEGGFFENQFEGVRQPVLFMIDSTGKFICKKEVESDSEMTSFPELAVLGSSIYAGVGYQSVRPLDDFSTTLVGQRNLGVWKTCLPCDTLTSITESDQAQQFALNIYPNPFSTQTQLTYRTLQGTRPMLQLTDMLGRVAQTVQLKSHEGTYTLDANELGTGIYFCTLLNGKEVLATQKVSVVRE